MFKKIFLFFPPLLLLLFLALSFFHIKNNQNTFTPKSDENKQIELIKDALQKSIFESTDNMEINKSQKFFKFQIKNNQKISTIILSLTKDPYLQITALQKAFKIARINNKHIKFIDLSLNHPYATLQNY